MPTVLILIVMVGIPALAAAQPQLLSDEELDAITVNDINVSGPSTECELDQSSGPCSVSHPEIFKEDTLDSLNNTTSFGRAEQLPQIFENSIIQIMQSPLGPPERPGGFPPAGVPSPGSGPVNGTNPYRQAMESSIRSTVHQLLQNPQTVNQFLQNPQQGLQTGAPPSSTLSP